MMLLSNKTRGLGRKGIVMFVVLGAILVLAVLVMSYNYFVRGKFNESREIIMHLRASKCAQATSDFVFSHLVSDLRASADETKAGDILRSKVFVTNNPKELSRLMKEEWFEKIGCQNFVAEILHETVGKKSFSSEVEFGFEDISLLKDLNKDDKVYFFPNEMIGRLTIRVTIQIDHTREVWQETRPFKVVSPFPIPITKFTFYWKDGLDGASDQYAFNTVVIDSETGNPVNGKAPFIFDNGLLGGDANASDNVWEERGWIYIGGDEICLNRACGDKSYGQRYYSYPRKDPGGPPSTLMLDFPGGDNWDKPEYSLSTGERLGFRVAHWGFSNAVIANKNENMWKKILKGEFDANPYELESNKTYWQSSCLHLFSAENVLESKSSFSPTITRVIGGVSDRFMELGYLLPTNSSTSIFAAVINYTDKKSFYDAVKDAGPTEEERIAGIPVYTFEKYLFFTGGFNFENDTNKVRDALQGYFENIEYFDSNEPNAISYSAVMSKVLKRDMNETYSVIAAYSDKSSEISLPPANLVPLTSELSFKPSMGNLNMGVLPTEMEKLYIDKIGDVKDTTLGMRLRTCYELNPTELDTMFGSNNSEDSGLYLNNLVYRVKSEDGNDGSVNLGSNLRIKSSGTIYSEGPINVGTFNKTVESEKSPVMILSGKGAISVDNSNNEVMAYLVALGEGGTVKANRKDAPLRIRGGMAVKEFAPENIPDQGGHLVYNKRLDPTGENTSFNRFFGVAFGPKGGKP